MTVLLYIFAAIGAVATIGGVIALMINAAQTNEDMQYYLHTRFPELEKEVAAKLYEFELKLNEQKNPVNETYILKEDYDCDWSEFSDRLDAIADDCIDRWCALLKNLEETNARLDDVIKKTGDYNIRFTRNAASLNDMKSDMQELFMEINKLRKDINDLATSCILKPAYNPDDVTLPRTTTGNSPYDIHLTEITVGDDPNQMNKGTTVC